VKVPKGLLTNLSNLIRHLASGEFGERDFGKLLYIIYLLFQILEVGSSPFSPSHLSNLINSLAGEKLVSKTSTLSSLKNRAQLWQFSRF
jgi:hypothetical protein